MADKTPAEFTLELTKILIWPALIVVATLWLGNDLKEILKSRTWKIGVLEVGDRISTLAETLQSELIVQEDYLNKILASHADAGKVREYADLALASLSNARKGIKKEIANIQETIPATAGAELRQAAPPAAAEPPGARPPATARDWEIAGFSYLLEKKIAPAVAAFSQAEKLWPDYHNVAEIRRLLIQNQDALRSAADPAWNELYRKILSQFSWGMPADARQQMQQRIGAS